MSNLDVIIELSPKETGALYMKSIDQAERITELELKVSRLEARGIADMQLVIEHQSSLILDLHASLRTIKQSSVTMEEHCRAERERIRDMQV
jgi:hypothetical protein